MFENQTKKRKYGNNDISTLISIWKIV